MGYQRLLEVLADPRHPEHAETAEWFDASGAARFALPRGGRDLRRDMEQLRQLAAGDDEDADGGAVQQALDQIPRKLVEAVLDLAPLQRAALVAVVAASLAEELEETTSLLARAAQHIKSARPAAPARRGRATARPRSHK